jgi:hypothetical protein
MRIDEGHQSPNTSVVYDFFNTAFEAADMAATFWQPMLKGVGRTQLELANLNARQGQAFMVWARAISSAPHPMSVMAANAQLFQSMTQGYADFAPRVAAAVSQATEPAAAFEILTLPARAKSRDRIHLNEPGDEAPRRVA